MKKTFEEITQELLKYANKKVTYYKSNHKYETKIRFMLKPLVNAHINKNTLCNLEYNLQTFFDIRDLLQDWVKYMTAERYLEENTTAIIGFIKTYIIDFKKCFSDFYENKHARYIYIGLIQDFDNKILKIFYNDTYELIGIYKKDKNKVNAHENKTEKQIKSVIYNTEDEQDEDDDYEEYADYL